jgi:hypothetical protein
MFAAAAPVPPAVPVTGPTSGDGWVLLAVAAALFVVWIGLALRASHRARSAERLLERETERVVGAAR